MRRTLLNLFAPWILILSCWVFPQEPARVGFDHEHGVLTRVLASHVHEDRVDYLELSRARGDLDMYLTSLTSQDALDFAQWSKPEQFAFWINAYNAFTLQAVLLNYPLDPLESLRDVGSKESGAVWKRKNLRLGHLLAGHPAAEISLDELLNLVLREKFKDARVHAALNNSCLGAPALRATAFSAAGLDRELDAAARAWMADPSRTKFEAATRSVAASVAFDNFQSDFVRESGSAQAWIARYAPLSERAWIEAPGKPLERKNLAFDWKLNDIERGAVK